MAENNPQAPQGSADKVVAADPAQAKNPKKDDKGKDSLLDIFTSEELEESSVSKLSKELGDISIYTLLQQTQQLAQSIKSGH